MVFYEENDNDILMEHASERFSLQMNRDDSEAVHDKSLSIGLPIPVTWIHNEMEDSRHDKLGYHRDINSCQLAPYRSSSSWSDADTKSFLLGLFIFGKNFIQIKRFLDNKGMGEILSLYYGKFYKTDGYRRWSECRKKKGRKCMIGRKLFTGLRQHELLSRLIPHVSEESQDNLLQVSKSYVEGTSSLEKYASSLKSIVGLGILVEAVGIGKEEGDLTRLDVEPAKNSRALKAPTCKALSSLGPSDIIQSLTGGLRLSKTKNNELFWEAVWPRLLARGWHSEQTKYRGYVTSEDYLVFLTPGVEKFSRRKQVKGDHYFDSVSDVLRKVVAEPSILELEEEAAAAKVIGFNEEEPEKGSNEDDLSDDKRQCYLKPRPFTTNNNHNKFMVIDTSLVHSGKPSDLRKLKSVPINSVGKAEVDAAGKKYKGQKYTRKVNRSKDISKSIIQNSTKLKVIHTNRLSEGKPLKLIVKQLKYPPVQLEKVSMMSTDLLRESNGGCSTDDSPRMVEAKMLIFGKPKINKTDSRRRVSNSDATIKKEAHENLDNDANKMIENQKNQHQYVFDDDRMKRITKNQFNRRVRSSDSNQAVAPIKRRKLTACAKAEKSRVIENFSGCFGSEKLEFSQCSSFQDANQNVCDLVSHQQNGISTSASADRSVEDDNEKSICNDSYQCTSFPCVKVKKCESFTFNIPQLPSKSKTKAITEEVVEEPLRIPCDVGSLEQEQHTDIIPRRQSTRNRPLTVRALECIANEFLHVQSRQKRKGIETHNKDPFNPWRKART
ncbi:hypothetical protein TSUD_396470 [Trifolium subterraneum]|uniref:SANT domain-containing protein n=1 Tax=Trifolium subterraneum TaxID=3900 RepID=A0A2Z6N1K2_TRISU|nr:hypothetical protein TSUD_396470 [Trifolium subterraneum]